MQHKSAGNNRLSVDIFNIRGTCTNETTVGQVIVLTKDKIRISKIKYFVSFIFSLLFKFVN